MAKHLIQGIVLTKADPNRPSSFRSTMTHPAAYASAGSRYRGPPAWEQVVRGLLAAGIIMFAIIGMLSCSHA